MKKTAFLLTGILIYSISSIAGNYLSFVQCESGHAALSYYQDGKIMVGGEAVSAVGLYEKGVNFARDPDTGELTWVNDFSFSSSGLNLAQNVLGRFLYLARGYSDEIIVMDRAADGSVTLIQTLEDGVDGVDGLENTNDVCLSPDGKNVYAVGRDDDAIAVFSRNLVNGTLSFLEVHFDTDTGVDGLDGAQSVAVSHDGAFVYVGSEADDAIAVFSRNTTTGALTYASMISNSDTGVSGLDYPKTILMPINSDYIFTSGYGITSFSRNASTGALSFVDHEGMAFAYSMVSHWKANRLYVSSSNSGVRVYEWDESTGNLTEVEQWSQGVDGMSCLASPSATFMSPDKASLYIGNQDGTLAVFSIAVFGDDLESGDFSRWSSSSP